MIFYSPELDEILFWVGCLDDGRVVNHQWLTGVYESPSKETCLDSLEIAHDWVLVGYL